MMVTPKRLSQPFPALTLVQSVSAVPRSGPVPCGDWQERCDGLAGCKAGGFSQQPLLRSTREGLAAVTTCGRTGGCGAWPLSSHHTFSIFCTERHLRVEPGPPRAPQVLGDGRGPAQRPPRLLLLPHRLALCAQAPRRHREGQEAGFHWPAGRPCRQVPEKVSASAGPCVQRSSRLMVWLWLIFISLFSIPAALVLGCLSSGPHCSHVADTCWLCGTSSEPCPCASAFPKSQGWLWKQLWQKLLGFWPSSLITGGNSTVTNCLSTEVHISLCKVLFGTPGPVQAKCHLSQDCHSIQD